MTALRLVPPPVRTCRSCSCTDDQACPGGCAWVANDWLDDDHNLCTACKDWSDAAAALHGQPLRPLELPARLSPRARLTPSLATRRRVRTVLLPRVARAIGWALVLTLLAGGVLYAGAVDFEAAGGAR